MRDKGVVQQCKSARSAELGSDHFLLVIRLKAKFKRFRYTARQRRAICNAAALKDKAVAAEFAQKVTEVLDESEEHDNRDAQCQRFKSALLAVGSTLLTRDKAPPKPMMSEATWELIRLKKAAWVQLKQEFGDGGMHTRCW